MFLAKLSQHDIRLIGTNEDDAARTSPTGYDSNTGLITIEEARSDIDFIDYATRKLTVNVVDSGGNPISALPESQGGGDVVVEVIGANGHETDTVTEENEVTKSELTLNPGEYTVTIQNTDIDSQSVDLTARDETVTMTIPVQIDLEIISEPPTLIPQDLWSEMMEDEEFAEFVAEFGITEDDNPEGYLYYYPPDPIPHVYKIRATANGQPVTGYVLTVRDNISQMTEDEAAEKGITATEGESEVGIEVFGGLPKVEFDDEGNAIPGEKFITFKASKQNYNDSALLTTGITVLGDVPKGTAEELIAVPNINYTVLHDPPGDGSYSYFDDSAVIKGTIENMRISYPNGEEIHVYPSPWSERNITLPDGTDAFDYTEDHDLGDTDTLGTQDSQSTAHNYQIDLLTKVGISVGKRAVASAILGAAMKWGSKKLAAGVTIAFAALSVPASIYSAYSDADNMDFRTDSESRNWIPIATPQIQYEISPRQRMQTPEGDATPDLIGPGKGDIYIGEGWTLALRDHYRFGIRWDDIDKIWETSSTEVKTFTTDRNEENQYVYTTRDIERVISDLTDSINALEDGSDKKKLLESSRDTWQNLLNRNRAYKWNRLYVDNEAKINSLEAKTDRTSEEEQYLSALQSAKHKIDAEGGDAFEAFKKSEGLTDRTIETLIFSGGPVYEYSRTISEGYFIEETTTSFVGDEAFLRTYGIYDLPPHSLYPIGVAIFGRTQFGSGDFVGKEYTLSHSLESGQQVEQKIGFVLHDDDVGDRLATYVCSDPQWGTPMFFQDPGSRTSDPWEAGTNKAVDVSLTLVEQPDGKFDYNEGAHYTIKVTYTGDRYYTGAKDVYDRTLQKIDFALFAPQPDNDDNLMVKFNGVHEPYVVGLNQDMKSATIALSLYPPEKDRDNSDEKEYEINIQVCEVADPQIARLLNLKPTFADLRAPRAIIRAPYDGERISPVFFPSADPGQGIDEKPFEIEVVSEDTDLASIQLQIRAKQPDGVWEPWDNLSGMKWFSVGLEYQSDLDSNNISQALQDEFSGNGFQLSANATVLVEIADTKWKITDNDNGKTYIVRKEEGQLSIYPDNISIFIQSDRRPPRREYTFGWTGDKMLAVGEYALRALATDRATDPNIDVDPPFVVIMRIV